MAAVRPQAAAAALAKARAQALVAALNLQRRKGLLESNFISPLDYDQSVAAKAQADAEVAAAEAALSRARIDLSYATVTAPISGRIGRAFVTEGALVRKHEATPLATIEQYSPIWADFALSSAIFLRLREAKAVGGPVTLLLDDGSASPHPGKLLFSDLAVDPSTGSVGMRPTPGRVWKNQRMPGHMGAERVTVILGILRTIVIGLLGPYVPA